MASGSFNLSTTSGTTHLKSKINWSSTSNGSSANSSNVTASMVLWRDNSGYTTYGTGTFSITINGNTKSESKSYSFTNSETTILSHTVTVPHNSDGTKTITISGSYSGDTPIAGNGSSSCALDNIDVNKITNFDGANDFTLEGTTSAWFTPFKSSYTHNLYIDLINDGNTWVARENYTSGSNITISDSEILNAYSQLGNYSPGQTVNVKYYLATFSGGTNIGGVSLWKTMTIGGTAKVNISGSWKKAIPYIKINDLWKPTISYVKANLSWKRGRV